jgi:hypothetical protein
VLSLHEASCHGSVLSGDRGPEPSLAKGLEARLAFEALPVVAGGIQAVRIASHHDVLRIAQMAPARRCWAEVC